MLFFIPFAHSMKKDICRHVCGTVDHKRSKRYKQSNCIFHPIGDINTYIKVDAD